MSETPTSETGVPATMQAIHIETPGAPDVMALKSIDTPIPSENQVLIRVKAAGVNRPDIIQRQGFYPPPPGSPDTLGLEIAGTVVALGSNVKSHAIGDAVCALVGGGGYA